MKNNLYSAILIIVSLSIAAAQIEAKPQGSNQQPKSDVSIAVYKIPTMPVEDRINDLMSQMTIEEKIAQMICEPLNHFTTDNEPDTQKLNALKNGIGQFRDHQNTAIPVTVNSHNKVQKYLLENTRLGIPAIIHGEGLHGYVNNDATSFPQALSLAGSWNLQLIDSVYSVIAKETRSRGVQQLLTPVLDIARDGRWGRFSETFGEDPFLTAEIGKQVVKSFQGTGETFLDDNHVICTLKHFPAHGSSYGGLNCAPSLTYGRLLRDVHMYPFTECVKAGAVSVMAMYGEIDGDPAHPSEHLIKDILREELGFRGFVVSDYGAIQLLTTGPQWEFHRHHVAADLADAAVLAVKAGVNIELVLPQGYNYLQELYDQNRISETDIDELVRPMLKAKFELGLFEDPFVDKKQAVQVNGSSSHDNLAFRAAQESIIMLKNDNKIAPLDLSSLNTIAVIGPNADRELLGDYSTTHPKYFSTVLAGVQKRAAGQAKVLYHQGCEITPEIPENAEQLLNDEKMIQDALDIAAQADVIIAVVGGDRNTAREGRDRSNLDLVGRQEELIEALAALNKPVIMCLIGGIPYAIPHLYEKVDVVYQCWNLGQETGNALASIIFGDYNPSAKLTVTIPKSVGHLPVFYNKKPTAYMRAYLYDDSAGGYCYPFGYGQSYTTYEYENLRFDKERLHMQDTLQVYVDVKNTGDIAGTETVQLYIHDKVSSVTRPMKELKAFEQATIQSGETKTVKLKVPVQNLAFHNRDMQLVVEPGDFSIMVGASSKDEDLMTKTITVLK